MKRVLWLGALTLLGLDLLLVAAAVSLMLLVTAHPFARELSIRNATSEAVRVTPLGCLESRPDREPLSLLSAPKSDPRRGRFPLGPGETLTLRYDDDDVHLSELVVESEGRAALALPAEDGAEAYEIADLAALGAATPEMLAVLEEAESLPSSPGSWPTALLAVITGAGVVFSIPLAIVCWALWPRRLRASPLDSA